MSGLRSVGLVLAAMIALAAHPAAASPISYPSVLPPPIQLVGGCGLGVGQGPGHECSPAPPPGWAHHRRGYYRGYRDGYVAGLADGAPAYVHSYYPYVRPYYHQQFLFGHACGLGYDVSCAFGICWRRCW